MPFTENHGARIYWDEQGAGAPVLMIMGLSYPSYMWHRSRPSFPRTIGPLLLITVALAKATFLLVRTQCR